MSAIDRGLMLHVGLPKTGSTTLQRALFRRHSQLNYLGKYGKRKGFLSEETYNALNPVLWDFDASVDKNKASKLWLEKFLRESPDDKYLVGSWEGLGNRPKRDYSRMLHGVYRVFGGCRILVVLRNPLTQVPSEYIKSISGHFIKRNKKWMGPSASIDIDTWFERRSYRGGTRHFPLNYTQNIQTSVDMLGKENVGILLFEELKENPASFYRAISDFIGIDAEETYSLAKQKHFHTRITQGQLDLIKKVDSSFLARPLMTRIAPRWRHRILKEMAKKTGPAKVELTSELRELIVNSTRDCHCWLVENFDLPLEGYGYPL